MSRQVLKSTLGGLIGIGVGVVAWFIFDKNNPNTRFFPILVGVLGTFVGVALTLPGVSGKRVGKGVAAGLVAGRLPGPIRGKVIDAIMGEDEEQPAQPSKPPASDDPSSGRG